MSPPGEVPAMSHVVHNLPFVAWGGLIGWLLAKAHRGWVVNLQRRRIQSLLAENAGLPRRRSARVR
jgi:hypothetical protein